MKCCLGVLWLRDSLCKGGDFANRKSQFRTLIDPNLNHAADQITQDFSSELTKTRLRSSCNSQLGSQTMLQYLSSKKYCVPMRVTKARQTNCIK